MGRRISKKRNKNRGHCLVSLSLSVPGSLKSVNLGGNTRQAYGCLMRLLGANDDIVLQAGRGRYD